MYGPSPPRSGGQGTVPTKPTRGTQLPRVASNPSLLSASPEGRTSGDFFGVVASPTASSTSLMPVPPASPGAPPGTVGAKKLSFTRSPFLLASNSSGLNATASTLTSSLSGGPSASTENFVTDFGPLVDVPELHNTTNSGGSSPSTTSLTPSNVSNLGSIIASVSINSNPAMSPPLSALQPHKVPSPFCALPPHYAITLQQSQVASDGPLHKAPSGILLLRDDGSGRPVAEGSAKLVRRNTPFDLRGISQLQSIAPGDSVAKFLIRPFAQSNTQETDNTESSGRRRSTLLEVVIEGVSSNCGSNVGSTSSPSPRNGPSPSVSPQLSPRAANPPSIVPSSVSAALSLLRKTSGRRQSARHKGVHASAPRIPAMFDGIVSVDEVDDARTLIVSIQDPIGIIYSFLRVREQRALRNASRMFVARFNDAVRNGQVALAGSRELMLAAAGDVGTALPSDHLAAASAPSAPMNWAPVSFKTACTAYLRSLIISTDAQPQLLRPDDTHLELNNCEGTKFRQLQCVIFNVCSKLESIGDDFLANSPLLETVVAGHEHAFDSLETIGMNFMMNCPALRSVSFPFDLSTAKGPRGSFVSLRSVSSMHSQSSLAGSEAPGAGPPAPSDTPSSGPVVPLSLRGSAPIFSSRAPQLRTIGRCFLSQNRSLTSVSLTSLPRLQSIGSSFAADCPSLVRVELGPMPALSSVQGNFLLNAAALQRLVMPAELPKLKLIGPHFLALHKPSASTATATASTEAEGMAASPRTSAATLCATSLFPSRRFEIPALPSVGYALHGFLTGRARLLDEIVTANATCVRDTDDSLSRLVRLAMNDVAFEEFRAEVAAGHAGTQRSLHIKIKSMRAFAAVKK